MDPRIQTAVGAGLVTTPFWVDLLQAMSLVAGTIAAITGAILGVHGVWKMIRGRK